MTQTDRTAPKAAGQGPTAGSKDFVVSADGHVLEPTDLFKTRLPKHLRERGGVGGGLRDRALRRGWCARLSSAAHPGLRGVDGLALPADARADARGRPRA